MKDTDNVFCKWNKPAQQNSFYNSFRFKNNLNAIIQIFYKKNHLPNLQLAVK